MVVGWRDEASLRPRGLRWGRAQGRGLPAGWIDRQERTGYPERSSKRRKFPRQLRLTKSETLTRQ